MFKFISIVIDVSCDSYKSHLRRYFTTLIDVSYHDYEC